MEPKRSITIAAIGTQSPDVILWPEDSFFTDYVKLGHEKDLESVAALASQAFVFGSMKDAGNGKEKNAAIVLAPDGKKLGEYIKRVPVQFVENCIPGTESPVFKVPSATLGVMICYDGTYPFVARDLVKAGAEVLLVPTMDVAGWGRIQHEHHALFYALRACELRRPVVRAASSGVTLALDAWGRTVARKEPFDSGTITAVVHPNDVETPYVQGGWLLPYVAGVVALVVLVLAFMKKDPKKIEE
jgi:apolipoprotein N-acyltransferase